MIDMNMEWQIAMEFNTSAMEFYTLVMEWNLTL